MRVFISWSGEQSRIIAEEMRLWLKDVIQSSEPFMSQHDIQKGTIWSDELDKELESDSFAIIVLTPDNVESPWINYEAGAIHKGIKGNKIATVLVDLDYSDLPNTLSKFNGAQFGKNELFEVIKSINSELDSSRLDENILKRSFLAHWPRLERAYEKSKSSGLYKQNQIEEVESNIIRELKNKYTVSITFNDDISNIIVRLIRAEKDEALSILSDWLEHGGDETTPRRIDKLREIMHWICELDLPIKQEAFVAVSTHVKERNDALVDATNQGRASHH